VQWWAAVNYLLVNYVHIVKLMEKNLTTQTDVVECLSKMLCQFLLVRFEVHMSKTSDKTDKFL